MGRLRPRVRPRIVGRMDEYRCQPAGGPIEAVVRLPGSKSLTNRALIAAALADGVSVLDGLLLAEDTRLMIDALRALGVAVTVDEAACRAEVTGCRGHLPASEARLLCGNSGTTLRFGAALVALSHGRFELDGVERMRRRPIGPLADALRRLGAAVEYPGEEGYPPIVVHARGLSGGEVRFDSPASSQWISALLLVAPYAASDVFLEISGEVPSEPYLDMTLAVMERFGVMALAPDGAPAGRFIVPAPQRYTGTTLAIEPDASNATYFLAAAAVCGGRVTVEGLGTGSVQGDVHFVALLEQMGCRAAREPDRLTVESPPAGERLRGIDVDLSAMPDTVPTLAVLALFAEGPTTIRNVANLRIKETDRLAALRVELSKLGATVEERPDGLSITPAEINGATIDTYADHRMAMSFALAGLGCPGVTIRDPQCCQKTFPDFFERFEQLIRPRS